MTTEPQLYSGATTYRMVASGFGVAIVARPLVSMTRPVGVVFIKPLREPSPMLDLAAAWRRDDPPPNLQAFLEVVRELAPVDIRTSAATAPNGQPSVDI